MVKAVPLRSAVVLTTLLAFLVGCGGDSSSGAPPLATDGASATEAVPFVECAPLAEPAAEGPGTFDAQDGFATLQKGPLALDQPGCSSTVTDLTVAENWTFQGTTDQVIVILVKAIGTGDPQLTVIDPEGLDFDTDDYSGGGKSARLVEQLPEDGVYTLRVAMFAPGGYTISVATGTLPPDTSSDTPEPDAPLEETAVP